MRSFAIGPLEDIDAPRPGVWSRLRRFGLLALAAGIVFATASPWLDPLGFDPAAVARGDVWRLLTGHIVHLSWPHIVANALGLGLSIAVLLELATPRAICGAALFIAAGISAVHLLVDFPSGSEFAGFSGILYGLTALAAFLLAGNDAAWAACIALALVASTAFGLSGWNPWGFETATAAHVTGGASGIAVGIWIRIHGSSQSRGSGRSDARQTHHATGSNAGSGD